MTAAGSYDFDDVIEEASLPLRCYLTFWRQRLQANQGVATLLSTAAATHAEGARD